MFFILIFIIGLIFGSFTNVLILRLNNGKKIVNARSSCPNCDHQLAVWDLVPIFSFIFLGGKCRYCHKKISWQYFLVELTTGILFVLAYWFESLRLVSGLGFDLSVFNFEFILTILRDWFFIIILITIFVYDLKWYQILDKITIPAIVLALGFNLWLKITWQNLLVASTVGLLFFLVQYVVSRGKWIGDGDLRLGFLMGAMLGWPNVVVAIFLAYIIGAVFSVFLLTRGIKKLKSQIPFGTFLSLATIIVLFWGDKIVNWYLSLL